MNRILFAAALVLLGSLSLDAARLDTNAIQRLIGLKGTWNEKEGVFKVSAPRTNVVVQVERTTLFPFMGVTSWASFMEGKKAEAMVMGDLALFEDEVNWTMSAALENGLRVTALHNHFFFEEPRVFFMHIDGEGSVEQLAAAVGKALATVQDIRKQYPKPLKNFLDGPPVSFMNSFDISPVEKIFDAKAQSYQGMYKFVFGRTAKMACGCEAGKDMGVNTWAAFYGTQDNAFVCGDFAATEDELQDVLKSLRSNKINIVAIHSHMLGETPRYVFLHYIGKGPPAKIAEAIKAARGTQAKSGATAARLEGGFNEIKPDEYELHRANGSVVLDVRSPEEFARGHVPSALNIDINAIGFADKVAQLDKSKPILVNCHAGARGAIASAELARLGFKTVCNLEGGLAAWEKAGNKPDEGAVQNK
jgi:rhodanese-related sulfurtransferase